MCVFALGGAEDQPSTLYVASFAPSPPANPSCGSNYTCPSLFTANSPTTVCANTTCSQADCCAGVPLSL